MTNEEAIKIIRSIDKAYRTFKKEEYKALTMAIKALEQEPCDDAISRQQCIDAVNKILAQYVPKIYLYTLPLELEKAITDLPSVSTEKTGYWIPDKHPLASPHCSICNGYGYKTDAFCRTCGAKMEVEE